MNKMIHLNGSVLVHLKNRNCIPAQKKGHVEKRREEGEELEGEHLDCEASLSFCW